MPLDLFDRDDRDDFFALDRASAASLGDERAELAEIAQTVGRTLDLHHILSPLADDGAALDE